MFSSPFEQLKQEIDEKIEDITQVITKFGDFNLLQAKLSNLKLKKLKLLALTGLPTAQPFAQNVMCAIDMMITESDIDIEVKTIRSSKNYKRMERRRRERFFRGPYARQSSSESECSEENIVNSKPFSKNTGQTAPLDLSNFFHGLKSLCNKSTNTEPVCIIKTKDNVMTYEERENEEDNFSHMSLEEEICPIEERKLPDKLGQPTVISTNPIEEFMTAREIVSSSKEVISSTKDDQCNTHILLDSIQSKWFDKTFESDKLVKELCVQISDQTKMSSSQTCSEQSQKNKKNKDKTPETSKGIDANLNSFYCKPHTYNTTNNRTTELKSNLSNKTPSKEATPESSHSRVINLFNTYKTIRSSDTCIKNNAELSNKMQSQNNSKGHDLPKTKNFNKSLESHNYLKKLDCEEKHASTPKCSSNSNSSKTLKKSSESENKSKEKSKESPDSLVQKKSSNKPVHSKHTIPDKQNSLFTDRMLDMQTSVLQIKDLLKQSLNRD